MQGGFVPKQRLLTLEDAAEAHNNINNSRLSNSKKVLVGHNADANNEDIYDPADYTDHLYDSDVGSAKQSTNWRQNLMNENKSNQNTFLLRQSAPQQ